ncbi:MAG: tRNA (guanosine(46)-N7)-methyltransferase TrmB [candidate division Zixibacteria bacterium]|nr:tRNA (guanosine(46)-N7)-methyltransferase TrmB [candidate division Zixibacteria bacterium]
MKEEEGTAVGLPGRFDLAGETPHTEVAVEFFVRDLDPSLCWADLFGNDDLVEIEIGSGKGRFITRSAERYPYVNYVGIERSLHYFREALARVEKEGLSNVRLLRDDATYLIEKFAPDASVAAYHVYFPDPWPKTRHRKRRLFNPAFLAHLYRTLAPAGTIDLATDHEGYFGQIVRLFERTEGFERSETLPERVAALGPGITHFEAKYLIEERPIYRACYVKKGVYLC